MNMKIEIINEIINVEGGYVNDLSDSGGETNYGITIKVARDYGYHGDMISLPRYIAFEIYSEKYWHSVCGDQLFELSPLVTKEVVDTSINMGVTRSSMFLQRVLNALNNCGRLYPDIKVDGRIGTQTTMTLSQYLRYRDDKTITKMLNCLQGAFYLELAERRKKDEKFIYGWFRRRVSL